MGTKIIFEVSEKDNKTQIHFTHQGLVAACECYDICYNEWSDYINNSLCNLITTGKGVQSKGKLMLEIRMNHIISFYPSGIHPAVHGN